jgi:hypothetical protein
MIKPVIYCVAACLFLPLLLEGQTPPSAQVPVRGDFAAGLDNWKLNLIEGAAAQVSMEPAGNGQEAIHIVVPRPTAKRYYVQLVCSGVSLQAGKTYHLHFRARSKPGGDIVVLAASYHGKYEELWRQENIVLGEAWADYTCDIKPASTDDLAQLILSGLGARAGDYWFAGISLSPGE